MTDKEIKKLNKQINEKNHEINRLITICNKYKQENTQLKQTIQEAYETERTQLGRNVLKQLLETIQ